MLAQSLQGSGKIANVIFQHTQHQSSIFKLRDVITSFSIGLSKTSALDTVASNVIKSVKVQMKQQARLKS